MVSPPDVHGSSAKALSEWTVSEAAVSLPVVSNSLSTTHHFISIKLTYQNFLFWRTQLVPFLRGQNLLRFVDRSYSCPPFTLSAASGASSAGVVNPNFSAWVQQDHVILSMLISLLFEEVLHLAIGRATSKEVWVSMEWALVSSSQARALNLLSQLQSLWQCAATMTEYLGKAQVLVEELTLTSRPILLDEQNLYIFRGLRPEFKSLVSSLSTRGEHVTLQELLDFLVAQEFIHAEDFDAVGNSSDVLSVYAALVARRDCRS